MLIQVRFSHKLVVRRLFQPDEHRLYVRRCDVTMPLKLLEGSVSFTKMSSKSIKKGLDTAELQVLLSEISWQKTFAVSVGRRHSLTINKILIVQLSE